MTTTATQFDPSAQQQAIYNWVSDAKGSAIVEAVAGAGKTTTLVHAVRLMGTASVAFCAYNKKIASEIGERLKAAGVTPGVRSGTFHSFGFGAVRKHFPKTVLNDKKLDVICAELKVPENFQKFVKEAISLAKQRAFGVLCPWDSETEWRDLVDHFELDESLCDENAVQSAVEMERLLTIGLEFARAGLERSVALDETIIDFDDMIFAPLIHNMRMWQNDWVLIDEAQDTNPARRALAKKMLRPGGRVLAVGDRRQAIYGFTGADADSMDLIKQEFGCIELPLTITYRCPKAVVRHAHQWVSHIESAPTAPEGSVRTMGEDAFKRAPAECFQAQDVVLCRNTKPLVELAYHFIRRGIPCHVEGKEIGRGLLALIGRWKIYDIATLSDRLNDYLARETTRLLAKGQETKAAAVTDRVETIFVIIEALPGDADVGTLKQYISELFDDSDTSRTRRLVLSTVHKAKGREWERVYLFGRNRYMPSKFARQAWQLDQEDNLCYVAVTRAKRELIEVTATL